MNDFEQDYWMGSEVGQLGGYEFQGAIFGEDGSCNDVKMGSGCSKFQGEEADKYARVCREEAGTSSNRLELGGVVLALQSASEPLLKISYYCGTTLQFCTLSRSG